MKFSLSPLKKLLFIIIFFVKTQLIFAEGNLIINNNLQVDGSTFEFDVCIVSADINFELTSYQCVLSFNNDILNGGTLILKYINGSSEISNKPLTNCILKENGIDKFLCFASNFGTDTISTSNKIIGRFRLENSVPFDPQFCEINWVTIQNPRSILTGAQVNDITNQFSFSGLNFIVPVELINVNAFSASSSVKIKWSTATELNNLGFEIQRKQLKLNSEFTKIGYVNGKGTSSDLNEYEFVDNNVTHNNQYCYRLKQIDIDGTYDYSPEIEVHFQQELNYILNQNYPNPFNPKTIINYQIPKSGLVIIKIYDLLGEEITTIVSEEKPAGEHNIEFEGDKLSSGIYLYQIQAGDFIDTKKMVLLK